MKKPPTIRIGLFASIGALLFGAGVTCLMFMDGIPRGHGSGSDFANGMIYFAIPIVAFFATGIGAIAGALVGLIVWLVAKLTTRRF